ncbi:unnamed protein product [Paramecium primaurelia]|uniref:Cyclin-like domain-containing protein n=1 Tax=Paramecium primaurelia TaxID=5886 RepID=A0A8S1KWF1_PARPR|nr:unnamed protein product [Paramecium primaurelia]
MDFDTNDYLRVRDIQLQEPISRQKIGQLEILIYWIFMISEKNNLNTKTIELAVILIKIYVSKNQIQPDNLQLLGLASLMIAIKFNECQTQINMNLDNFVSQSNFEFSSKLILEMEMSILSLVEYDVNITTITDYYNGLAVDSDLILFVTLDSDFLYYQKYELFEAITNYYSQDTQNLPTKVKNIIYKINQKINHLTQTENIETPKIRRRKIFKRKFRSVKQQKNSGILQ